MIDPFEWVNSQDWGIESLKAALANEMAHTRKLEEKNASLARKIERLSVELEDAQAMVRTLMEQRDTVEIYQSHGPKTEPDDIGFVSEVRWVHGDTVCLDIGTLASTCDVRRTTQAVTETTDRIKVGDEVEVFQATINPWTCKGEIGQRGVVTGIISEIGWRNSHCIHVDVVEIGEDNAFAICDVRKVC